MISLSRLPRPGWPRMTVQGLQYPYRTIDLDRCPISIPLAAVSRQEKTQPKPAPKQLEFYSWAMMNAMRGLCTGAGSCDGF